MNARRRRWSTANVLIAIFLTAGLFLGIGLVVLGGKKDEPTKGGGHNEAPSVSDRSSSSTRPSGPPRELKITDTTSAGIAKATGLAFPVAMTDFLTAELKGGSQLDITFVMSSEDAAQFISGSGLPKLKADKRLILHSSPLWKLNPEEGTTLSSAQDDHGDVHRVVELLSNKETGEGKLRARIVITPN